MTDGPTSALEIFRDVQLDEPTMLLAFSGWMDGGDVSSGTVERIIEQRGGEPFARIDPEPFTIYNLPGSMEIAALFRPAVEVLEGQLQSIRMPTNRCYADLSKDLVLFVGKEPNLRWPTFGDCLYELAAKMKVKRTIFVGSYAGAVPHTRQPRLYASASHARLLDELLPHGIRPSTYEGPGGFSSYLMSRTAEHGMEMINLVVEIPAYIQGRNPMCIEAVTRRLAQLLDLPLDVETLRTTSDEWEQHVTDAVGRDEELAARIREMEEAYDDDLLEQEADHSGE